MFTGIIEHRGTIARKDGARYTVRAPKAVVAKLKHGTSIAVNGACLTVVGKKKDSFAIEVMPETEKRTTFGALFEGSRVNLELPATAATFLSGHIVQGHIDGVGTVKKIAREGNSRRIAIEIPGALSNYIVKKGSIAVQGVSLTVVDIRGKLCTVGIIPFTYSHTTLGTLRVGDRVNLEADVLAKYVERMAKRI